ncbi:Helicase, partial [human gut metagenome]
LDSFDVSRVLVIAPLRVARDTWSDEAAKWDDLNGLEVACAVGSPGQRIRALESGAPVTTIGRENVCCGDGHPNI